jgi:hypothetical protein
MAMKLQLRTAMAVACMALAMVWGTARADEVPIVTGKHWTQSSEQMKRAYLIGVANIVQIDVAYQAGNPPADNQSVIPRLAKGLKGQTLDTVREGLDNWYSAHPDQLQRPVLETVWFEMVVPGLQKDK